jgi:hypothetical protein
VGNGGIAPQSALRIGHALLPRNIIFLLLVLISVKRPSKYQGLVRSEGLCRLKESITSSGLEPATFWLVA